jgi:hypothetical protein
MQPFHIDELIGEIVVLELDNSEVVSGALAGGWNNYIVLRDSKGKPLLFHERFVRAMFPEEVTDDSAK